MTLFQDPTRIAEVRRHNEQLLEELQVGDLVQFPRGMYSHWAVYIGDGEVVHLAGEEDDGLGGKMGGKIIDVNHLFSISGEYYTRAYVKVDPFLVVAADCKAIRDNSKDEVWTPLPPEEIKANAIGLLGEADYNLLHYNCEHFATWCRYGQKSSDQAEVVLNKVTAIRNTTVVDLASRAAAADMQSISQAVDQHVAGVAKMANTAGLDVVDIHSIRGRAAEHVAEVANIASSAALVIAQTAGPELEKAVSQISQAARWKGNGPVTADCSVVDQKGNDPVAADDLGVDQKGNGPVMADDLGVDHKSNVPGKADCSGVDQKGGGPVKADCSGVNQKGGGPGKADCSGVDQKGGGPGKADCSGVDQKGGGPVKADCSGVDQKGGGPGKADCSGVDQMSNVPGKADCSGVDQKGGGPGKADCSGVDQKGGGPGKADCSGVDHKSNVPGKADCSGVDQKVDQITGADVDAF
ncbi:hypothetical protein BaRGS_00004309 [Batillaria attramentaria]|uniref:LRAT domain-containing protein n=1 Tax=Batillaria attramentaria TaxID=370345 RepID=A0ABD0LYB9_9CAEN